MVVNRNDKYIGRSLLEYGEFSEGEVELFSDLIDETDTVIDAGANFGALTVPLADICRFVFAFEPQPKIFECLAGNIALNSIRNAKVFEAALSDQPGTMAIPFLNPMTANSFGSLDIRRDAPVKVPVRIMTIDGLELQQCGMIKVDVEGMEESVLKGAEKTIERCRPLLYVEDDRHENSASLMHFMRSRSYHLWQHWPFLFREDNYCGLLTNIWDPNLASFNVLAWPAERPGPGEELIARHQLRPIGVESANPHADSADEQPQEPVVPVPLSI